MSENEKCALCSNQVIQCPECKSKCLCQCECTKDEINCECCNKPMFPCALCGQYTHRKEHCKVCSAKIHKGNLKAASDFVDAYKRQFVHETGECCGGCKYFTPGYDDNDDHQILHGDCKKIMEVAIEVLREEQHAHVNSDTEAMYWCKEFKKVDDPYRYSKFKPERNGHQYRKIILENGRWRYE